VIYFNLIINIFLKIKFRRQKRIYIIKENIGLVVGFEGYHNASVKKREGNYGIDC